ncbi:MAG: Spy/CpxP family protein refolding chaperone [Alphaproteobacteria bacterium]|nr:Spy/CpxP family protein refolding chaperone [Alphaproteobacteria bacterium]
MATALFAGVAAIGQTPALAETAPASTGPAAQIEAHRHGEAWMTPSQLVDGRIAFLKAELKITPAQEVQWQQFAAAMRQNAQSLDQVIATARQHRGTASNAVDQMEMRAEFAKVRADNAARLAGAFRPVYASLSPEQQQTANALMRHEGRHHGWHHRA